MNLQPDKLHGSFKSEKVVLFSILVLGFTLRALFVNWGLPEIFEEATPLRIVTRFLSLAGTGFSLNPKFFNYPALTFYLQLVIQLIHYAIGHLAGAYPTLQAFMASTTPVVIVARMTGVLFDIGTVILVYIFTIEYSDHKTALLAALLSAINPLLVQHAHFIEVDIPLTFFCMLSILYIFRICTNPTSKNYILAGISIGLAAATKYTGAFLLPVLIAGHVLRSSSLRNVIDGFRDIRMYKSLLISIIIFLLFNPYIILDFQQFKKDFSFEQFHVSYGHLGIDTSQSTLMFYLDEIVHSSYGIILSVIIAVMIIIYITRHQKIRLFLMIFPVLYFIIVATWEMRADRYILPIIPILGIVAADGVIHFSVWIHSLWTKKFNTQLTSAILALIFCVILLLSAPFCFSPPCPLSPFSQENT
jgi:4-amino-4-deoxy-L-arabinose transferase-like glycosyltransferase